ncbi:MAG: hypothetical protein ACUVS9_05890 [Thermaceae bacterium]
MRKLHVLLVVLSFLSVGAFAESSQAGVPEFVDLAITFSLPKANPDGSVDSAWGLGLGGLGGWGLGLGFFGLSYRSYFEPLAAGEGSFYWETSAPFLVVFGVGVGYDYRVNDKVYVGGGVDIWPILHFAGRLPITLNLHVGVFLY